jgi:hypothetical protein
MAGVGHSRPRPPSWPAIPPPFDLGVHNGASRVRRSVTFMLVVIVWVLHKAVDKLGARGVDVTGTAYKPLTVTLKEGGG